MIRVLAIGSSLAVVVSLALGSAPDPSSANPRAAHVARPMSSQNCPAYPGGTGLLTDGDFSEAPDPGDSWPTFNKRQVFAPHWRVAKRNIDFYGTLGWGYNAGLCSVDLDGWNAGGIEHRGVPTTQGAHYSLTFLFSGSSVPGCRSVSPQVKTVVVSAASQSQTFTWDTANGNTVENDLWAMESFTFVAQASRTTVKLKSTDAKDSNCGPVVAAIAVTQTSR
jgi:Protein of unknown function (DUF642)